jgi:hypothetical protein
MLPQSVDDIGVNCTVYMSSPQQLLARQGARASTNKATMRAYGQLSTPHAPNRGQARTSRCSRHAMLNDAHGGPVAGVPRGRLQFHDPALELLLSRNAFAARKPSRASRGG